MRNENMIGSGLKKLAAEKGMTVAHGVAYGAYQGFALTMSEGNGWKALEFATRFSEPAAADELERKLNEVDMKRTYRVRDLLIGQRSIAIVFLDNPGTMKKIHAFLDWFMPLLEESGAAKVNVCNECGCDTLGDDSWVLIDGVAHHMHAACKEKVKRELAAENQERVEESGGSYLTGALGAAVGALIGAGELGDVTYSDIPTFILFMLMNDGQYLTTTLSNIGMGLLFAGLGVFGLLRKAKKEVSGIRVIDL